MTLTWNSNNSSKELTIVLLPFPRRLLFTTTGVLLRRLATGDSDLSSISHVIVDEVHERSVDSDFLLLELREVLKRNHQIKIILMSATINSELFSKYFSDAPCIEIPGRTFPVADHYLEEIIADLDYQPRSSSYAYGEKKANEKQAAALRSSLEALNLNENKMKLVDTISKSDRLDYDLVGAVVKFVCEKAKEECLYLPLLLQMMPQNQDRMKLGLAVSL